ncbi:MAG: RNA polymerase recycling motor HelD [Bacillota bacterium]
MDETQRRQEQERLEEVLKEAHKQYHENCEADERLEQEAVATQKELWEDVGPVSVSNGLHQLVDFLQFIDTMKRQKRSHGFLEQLKEKYRRMLYSPYFGRVDFRGSGDETALAYYIGTSSLINDDYEILIYDWRAPVSGMFYDYEIGEASYECPDGIVHGVISLKRQYKISDGKLIYLFDSNLKIDDEMLQQILSNSVDNKMKTIVTSIQREQNRVIRNEQFRNLIVQGAAGSGKTSVALHRAAYLLYKYRGQLTARNIAIFSPNSIFNDYISNVLPELGEENLLQTTFEEFMRGTLRVSLKTESYYDMMEYMLAGSERPAYPLRVRNMRYKSSMKFRDILQRYVAAVEAESRNFPDIELHGRLLASAGELRALYQDYACLPLTGRLQRMRARMLFLLKSYEEERAKEVAREISEADSFLNSAELKKASLDAARNETRALRAQIDRLTSFNIVEVYRRLFERLAHFEAEERKTEADEIARYTLENLAAGQLYYEDQIALLYLQGVLGGVARASDIKFVIVDEAQDYTPLQVEIFRQLFGHASFTMLGDMNQSIHPYMHIGDYDNIASIFPQEDTLLLHLTKSYRSTVEITRFSRAILHRDVWEETVERHGDEPVVLGFATERAMRERICEDIGTYKDRGFQSVGILTRTKREAVALYDALKAGVQLTAVVSGEQAYVRGTVVLPAYLAKGLEFDVVILYHAGEYVREEERLLLYTACTRALHALCVYYCGDKSPLLPESV